MRIAGIGERLNFGRFRKSGFRDRIVQEGAVRPV
jgi:hypothetical protein